MNELLEYLSRVEGEEIHYNSDELDITSPYGIYRYEHPNAAIFNYIDEVATSIGITLKSDAWGYFEIDKVNNALDNEKVKYFVSDFYHSYLENAHLELFPKECIVAMFSIFTNSPLYAWKSTQQALKIFEKNVKGVILGELSIIDGAYGTKTKKALRDLSDYCEVHDMAGLYFESLMVSCMKSYYIDIAKSNSSKIKYLSGWDNRVQGLL